MKIALSSLFPEEIAESFPLDQNYRAHQIFSWIQKGIISFDTMTNLPASLHRMLEERSNISTFKNIIPYTDTDGTVKLRITLKDSLIIKSVLLEDPGGRKTICLSSQAGCGMGCTFCKTGTMGLKRNLEAHEIIEQFLCFKRDYGEIQNIVFMGMGEPFLNLEQVKKAIEVLHHPYGNNISLRKFTISTCGIEGGIQALTLHGPHVQLAFSLITADEALRKTLMPCTESHSLKKVKDALLLYQKKTKQRITLEIVLIKDVNDRPQDITYLLEFIPPLNTSINLIPWNPISDMPYGRPDSKKILWFKKTLQSTGINVTQRYLKGRRINAACGQLAF
jgi:23S rRNA (adenine2503-C2)-methyltransferase